MCILIYCICSDGFHAFWTSDYDVYLQCMFVHKSSNVLDYGRRGHRRNASFFVTHSDLGHSLLSLYLDEEVEILDFINKLFLSLFLSKNQESSSSLCWEWGPTPGGPAASIACFSGTHVGLYLVALLLSWGGNEQVSLCVAYWAGCLGSFRLVPLPTHSQV